MSDDVNPQTSLRDALREAIRLNESLTGNDAARRDALVARLRFASAEESADV